MRIPDSPLRIVWHPHQKLWNGRLERGLGLLPGHAVLVRLLVAVDSLLLAGRVVLRRARRLGWRSLVGRPALPPRMLYVDCGLHREGLQVGSVLEWFGDRAAVSVIGYEASADHYAAVEKKFVGHPVDLRNEALVGPQHAEPVVRLYKDGGDGKGDSLFSERGETFETVPAVRLSAALREYAGEHGHQPVILRMNIEGAESFVIDDLIDAGMVGEVAGYYGMWDDLSKIDRRRDAAFRRLLRREGIRTVTFNDRDYRHRLRLWAVRYDMTTALAASTVR
jgi:hypothetical protein